MVIRIIFLRIKKKNIFKYIMILWKVYYEKFMNFLSKLSFRKRSEGLVIGYLILYLII